MLHEQLVEFGRRHQATALYAARRTRLDAYARWISRYGYQFDRVVFVHRLSAAGASADEGASHELRRGRVDLPVPGAEPDAAPGPGPGADLRHDDSGAARADGPSPGDGDLGSAAASR